MKKVLCFLLLVACHLSAKNLQYTITEHPYRLSTYYEMHGEEGYVGRVIKQALSIRTCYALYDADGILKGEGICKIGLGSLYPWARLINLYDEKGEILGVIDGQFLTTAAAKYQVYNSQGLLVAYAYLDTSGAGFNVVDASDLERPLAYLKRNFSQKDWAVTLYAGKTLDERLIQIFSAFVVDHQNYFKT